LSYYLFIIHSQFFYQHLSAQLSNKRSSPSTS